mgnify:CR=1 FL=1
MKRISTITISILLSIICQESLKAQVTMPRLKEDSNRAGCLFHSYEFKEIEDSKTKFYRGSLRSGQKIEYEGSLVILGDVNGGAEVVAEENIIIKVELNGLTKESDEVSITSQIENLQSASLSFANKAQRTVFTSNQQVWTQNGVTLTNDKAASTSNVADYANPARFYKSSKITIEAPGNITKIVFDCNSSSYATALKSSITSGGTVSVNSDKVTVVLTDPATSFVIASLSGGQVRMDGLTVTYEN